MEVQKVVEEWEIWDEEEKAAKSEAEVKKLVPERFHNTKGGFIPRKEKIYPFSRKKRKEVCKFIAKQLRKGYIRLSKSSQMAPVFFVRKKDGKKQMVQNYRYLNEWTVKNNYPLSLISDIVKNIGTKKIFTKMDLQQGYNNVWIKERDE